MISLERLQALREETPGLASAVHLNHAGASLPPNCVLEAIHEHLALEARLGPMEAAEVVVPRIHALRHDAAKLLNAQPEEIAFMSSGSSALGAVFAAMRPLRSGDRILVGRQEWGGNLATYQRAAQRVGAHVDVIPTQADGSVDADALARCIDDRVRLISLTWVPANGGLINDAAAVGRVARSAGVPFFIDAAQALGQMPVDVQTLHCDVLKSAGRKHLRGPRGTAVLYVRRQFLSQLEPAWVDVLSAPWATAGSILRDDARRFETSEAPVALWLGLARAIALVLDLGVPAIQAQVQELAMYARQRLSAIPGVTLQDLGTAPYSGLVSFTRQGHDAMELKQILAVRGIHVGANGVAYTPLDMRTRGLTSVIRASFSYLNEPSEVDRLAAALE